MNEFGASSGAPTPFWKVRFGALSNPAGSGNARYQTTVLTPQERLPHSVLRLLCRQLATSSDQKRGQKKKLVTGLLNAKSWRLYEQRRGRFL